MKDTIKSDNGIAYHRARTLVESVHKVTCAFLLRCFVIGPPSQTFCNFDIAECRRFGLTPLISHLTMSGG